MQIEMSNLRISCTVNGERRSLLKGIVGDKTMLRFWNKHQKMQLVVMQLTRYKPGSLQDERAGPSEFNDEDDDTEVFYCAIVVQSPSFKFRFYNLSTNLFRCNLLQYHLEWVWRFLTYAGTTVGLCWIANIQVSFYFCCAPWVSDVLCAVDAALLLLKEMRGFLISLKALSKFHFQLYHSLATNDGF